MDTPKLRFRGFDQPWKEDIIGSLFSERIERDANGEMLSVSMRNGVIKASDNGKADNSSDDKSHYKVVKINDIPYNTMRMWQGACGCSKYDGIVSPAYTVLNPHENVNSAFFAQSFRTFKTLKVFKTFSQGLSSDNWNLKFDTIKLISTLFPENPLEQQLIISFIQDLDRLIDIYNNDVLRLTHAKVASMVSMFPQKGENAPRVRFKGYDDPWTVDSIGNLFDERTERSSNGEMLSVTMRNGVIKASENGKVDNSSEDKSHYKVVKVNDIPYNTMRMWQGACGCSDFDGIVSPAYTVLIPKNGVDPSFFAVMFKTQIMLNEFKAHSQGLTSDNWNLKYAVISAIPIKHPSSLAEQQKIAEFFRNLDRQIECQTQILERLKRVKAACLDQMFV